MRRCSRMPAPPSPVSAPMPRSAVFVRPDTLGDLVLFAPVLRCLRSAWPQAELTVIARQAYLELARLLVPDVTWWGTQTDVFAHGPDEVPEELARLQAWVRQRNPDLVVGACSHRTWLEGAVAASAPSARHVVLGAAGEDPFFGARLRRILGPAADQAAYTEEAPPAPCLQDWERNYGLAEYLLARSVPHLPPALTIGAEPLRAADQILAGLKLEPGRFLVCAAAGFANVRLKTWPADRFGAVLGRVPGRYGLGVLLVGETSERPHLEVVQAAGAGAAAIWTGGAGDLVLLAALVARSRLYFGNDTGTMHLAAALGRPVVAVFGGGTWPRFQPAAAQTAILVHPLPCFGCGWDCPFGDAPCVKAVGVAEAEAALAEALQRGEEPFHDLRAYHTLPEPMIDLMGRAAALFRERAADHRHRQAKIDDLQAACDERLALIQRLDADLHRLLREANDREHVIADLRRQLAAE
jgi:ADP-heptose:LPS heptosyltransferase